MTTAPREPKKLALLGASVLLLGIAYRNLLTLGTRYGSVQYEVEEWLMSPNDRAPLIVVALAMWLAWRRWPVLRALPQRGAPLWQALPCLALGLASGLWAVSVRADDLLAISLIANLAGLLLLQWGGAGLRVMCVPLLFLLFCIPLPAPLLVTVLWKLRLATADYTGWILYVLGLPAFVSGDQITRATQNFQVIEGCSGLRSMETLTMLSILMIDLFRRRGWHAAVLLVSAPMVAFAMNGLRVLTLILNPHSEIVEIHSLQGIAILLVGLLALYFLDMGIETAMRLRAPSDDAAGGAETPPASDSPPARGLGLPALLATGAVMALATVATPAARYPRLSAVDLEALMVEALGEDARYEEEKEDLYFHGNVRFRHKLHRRYPRGATQLQVFVATGDRRDRRTSIVSPITRLPGTGWMVRDSWTTEIDGHPVEASLIEKGRERRLSIHWYEGRSGLWSETLRALLGIDRSALAAGEPVAVARLGTRAPSGLEGPGRQRAMARLEEAYRAMAPALRNRLESAKRESPATGEGAGGET